MKPLPLVYDRWDGPGEPRIYVITFNQNEAVSRANSLERIRSGGIGGIGRRVDPGRFQRVEFISQHSRDARLMGARGWVVFEHRPDDSGLMQEIDRRVRSGVLSHMPDLETALFYMQQRAEWLGQETYWGKRIPTTGFMGGEFDFEAEYGADLRETAHGVVFHRDWLAGIDQITKDDL